MRTMVSDRDCLDMHGRTINPGYHYVPGPGACNFCVCTDGMPKFCKPVLCQPPTDCKSFRVGLSCCEYICLDSELKDDTMQEMSLRYVASAIAFVLVTSVAMFFIFRIRKRKMQQRAMRNEDRRSLTSIGGYEREDNQSVFPGYKPSYVPRGEAPPPYDEAIAQARVDQMRFINEQRSAIASHAAAIEATMRQEEPPRPSSMHIYTNTPRSNAIAAAQYAANQAYLFNAPLLHPNPHLVAERELHSLPILPPGPRAMQSLRSAQPYNLPDLVRLGARAASSGAAVAFPTGSLGTITNRGLINMIHRSADHTPISQSLNLHRTIPRFSTPMDGLSFDPNPDPNFVRASRLHYLQTRRSFHRPSENRPTLAENNSSSIPGNLDLTSSGDRRIEDSRPDGRPNARMEPEGGSGSPEASTSRFTLHKFNQNFVDDAAQNQKGTILHLMGLFNEMLPEQHRVQIPDLPTDVDKPSCLCYTDSAGDEGDGDEYHSECENCKSANSSRWVLDENYADEEGTQTLQRRAPPSAAPSPATATLPQPLTKQRSNPGLTSNWDNWFTVIRDSSSSDEE